MYDELELDLRSGTTSADIDHLARKAMMRGQHALTHAEMRALGEATGKGVTENGFYLAPSTFAKECVYKIRALNPIRRHGARVFRNVGYSLSVPVVYDDITALYTVRDTNNDVPMTEYTTTPTFSRPIDGTEVGEGVLLYPRQQYVYFRASLELLQDTSEDNGPALERLLADMAAQAFVQSEVEQIIRGSGDNDDPMNAKRLGLSLQLTNSARLSSAVGTAASAFTAAELAQIIERLSSGRYARAIHWWHPRMLGILASSFDAMFFGTNFAKAKDDTMMMLAGRPLFIEPTILATGADFIAGAKAGYVIDPTAYVFAESGPPVALRRLDELGAANGQVLFQACRRIDFALADVDAALAIVL
jgi:HK97 family phage major capsid protein